ncbi:hypothetical protein DPMN_072598 [Dreissena polymorpha]|uniref:Uncharacterized protein n=1 Tax=Dreissena polymorpha TaxID=45954 RepID=A0A9D4H9M6_DREPO|nr:hypothetical protein DPMN_072598 [Dreissena polymorpha]
MIDVLHELRTSNASYADPLERFDNQQTCVNSEVPSGRHGAHAQCVCLFYGLRLRQWDVTKDFHGAYVEILVKTVRRMYGYMAYFRAYNQTFFTGMFFQNKMPIYF